MKEVLTQLSFFPIRYYDGFFRRFKLPILLILFTFIRLKRPLKWGREIYPLDFTVLRDLVRSSLYKKDLARKAEGPAFYHHYWQLITPVSSREEKLLSLSLNLFVPHEVAQIVIKMKNGTVVESGVCHGFFFSMGSAQKILQMIKRLIEKEQLLATEIAKITILHTHPSVDFILDTQDSESFLYLNALSKSDLQLAAFISKRYRNYIDIKAITHSNLSFAVSFFQGKVLEY